MKSKFHKKSQSKILASILLILLILVLIVLLWNLLMSLIREKSEIAKIKADLIKTRITIDDKPSFYTADGENYIRINLHRDREKLKLIREETIEKYADIVFIVDSTKSMEDEINEAKETMQTFVDNLGDVNYRLALTEFQDYPTIPCGEPGDKPFGIYDFYNNIFKTDSDTVEEPFTTDIVKFKNAFPTSLSSGNDPPESHLTAIKEALKFTYRNPSDGELKKIIILMTDAPPHANDCKCDEPKDYDTLALGCYSEKAVNHDLFLYDGNVKRVTDDQLTGNPVVQRIYSVSGDKIAWDNYENRYYDIHICDLENKPAATTVVDWCKTPATNENGDDGGLIDITDTPSISEAYSAISGNRIIWSDFAYAYECNFGTRKGTALRDYCRLEKVNLTTAFPIWAWFSVSGDKFVWHEKVPGSGSVDTDGNDIIECYAEKYKVYLYDITLGKKYEITTDTVLPRIPGDLKEDPQKKPSCTNERLLKRPEISQNKIVWFNYKYEVDKKASQLQTDIYMCDLNGATKPINQWCQTLITDGGGLIDFATSSISETSPDISGDKVVWNEGGSIYYCDFAGQLSTNIANYCQNNKVKVATGYSVRIGGNIITWMASSDVYLCDITLNGGSGGCLHNDVKTRLTNDGDYNIAIDLRISDIGDKIVWGKYPKAIVGNTLSYITCYKGPTTIEGIENELKSGGFTFYYINKEGYMKAGQEGGLCKNERMKAVTTATNGKFYSYDEANQIKGIISSLANEIITVYETERGSWEYLKVVFYTKDGKSGFKRIDNPPKPLETNPYDIPLPTGFTDDTIKRIEVYLGVLASDGTEVLSFLDSFDFSS